MPRPRTISDAAVREAEDLIARGGGIRRTARILGIKESSLRARLGQRRAVDDVMDRFLYGRAA